MAVGRDGDVVRNAAKPQEFHHLAKFLMADGIAVGTEQVFTDILLVGFAGLGGILLRNEDEPQVGIVLKLAAQDTTFFYGLL